MLKAMTVALALLPGMGATQSVDGMMLAINLGKVIGSEHYCGLSYDQPAIEAWIAANIPAEDLTFPQYLQLGTDTEGYEQRERSVSAKTAHCAAIRCSAAHFGFTGG